MSRVHHQQGGEPSQRMLRVAELIRHAMSELLVRSALGDPLLESQAVTIQEVRMSPDLKLATIYVMPLGGKNSAEVLAALDRHKNFLRGEIAHRVNLQIRARHSLQGRPRGSTTAPRSTPCSNSPAVKRDLAKTG